LKYVRSEHAGIKHTRRGIIPVGADSIKPVSEIAGRRTPSPGVILALAGVWWAAPASAQTDEIQVYDASIATLQNQHLGGCSPPLPQGESRQK
jgi:hypothetical protein